MLCDVPPYSDRRFAPPQIVRSEVAVQVPVEKVVIKEVPVEKIVSQDRYFEVPVDREVSRLPSSSATPRHRVSHPASQPSTPAVDLLPRISADLSWDAHSPAFPDPRPTSSSSP